MIDGSKIAFNAKLRMSIQVDEQPESVLLELSHSLEASEQELQPQYKDRIAKFINASGTWYRTAIEKLRSEEGDPGKVRLLQIFVLSEQDENKLTFGLEFRVEVDVEHGRGLKVDGETLEVVDYGSGDVAFSLD